MEAQARFRGGAPSKDVVASAQPDHGYSGRGSEVSRRTSAASSRPRTKPDDFLTIKFLGKGSTGTVSKVMHKSSGNVYALKAVCKKLIVDHNLGEQLLAEVRTQMTVRHANVIQCLDYFEDRENVYLVLEFATGGDLYRRLRSGPLSEREAAHVFVQVARGVQHLHSLNIVHRDLKPENIMIGSKDDPLGAKVADFGWCSRKEQRSTLCGTPCMLAPEMIRGQGYDHRVDNWALGVLLFEMLVGSSPFEGQGGLMETCARIINEGFDAGRLKKLPESARPIVSGLLQPLPEDRMSLEDAIAHPWVVARVSAGTLAAGSRCESIAAATAASYAATASSEQGAEAGDGAVTRQSGASETSTRSPPFARANHEDPGPRKCSDEVPRVEADLSWPSPKAHFVDAEVPPDALVTTVQRAPRLRRRCETLSHGMLEEGARMGHTWASELRQGALADHAPVHRDGTRDRHLRRAETLPQPMAPEPPLDELPPSLGNCVLCGEPLPCDMQEIELHSLRCQRRGKLTPLSCQDRSTTSSASTRASTESNFGGLFGTDFHSPHRVSR